MTRTADEIMLVCFPPAGASATFYRELHGRWSETVQVCALELPGRGRRWSEPSPESVRDALASLLPQLRSLSNQASFGLFGHSYGALLAYEAARAFERSPELRSLPRALFVSACAAPHRLHPERWSRAPTNELIAYLRGLGGLPAEFLDHTEQMEVFVPAFRADLRAYETYAPPGDSKVRCPVIVLWGTDDRAELVDSVRAWKSYSSARAWEYQFDGGHFFLFDHAEALEAIVQRHLGSDRD
jgi:surfactin synthase thioesterase subunit